MSELRDGKTVDIGKVDDSLLEGVGCSGSGREWEAGGEMRGDAQVEVMDRRRELLWRADINESEGKDRWYVSVPGFCGRTGGEKG